MQAFNKIKIHQDNLLGAFVLALVLFACIMPLTLSFLPQLLAMLCIPYLWKSKAHHFSFIPRGYLLWVMGLPALCLASVSWSILPEESFDRALKIIGIILSYSSFLLFILNLSSTSVSYIKQFFYVPLVIAGCYLSIELIFGLPIRHLVSAKEAVLYNWELNKNVAIFLLLLPFGFLSIYFSGNKKRQGLLFIPLVLILLFTDSQASWLSFAAMVMIGLAGYYSSVFLKICFAGLSGVLLFMPLAGPLMYQYFAAPMGNGILRLTSFSARLEIWDFVSRKILERPFLGFGLDSTRYMTFDNPGRYHVGNTVMHPHNAALQLWNDFGLFGAIVILASIVVLFRWVLQRDKVSRILCSMTIAGLSVFLLVSWSLWASWLLGFIFFLAIISIIFTQDAFLTAQEEVVKDT